MKANPCQLQWPSFLFVSYPITTLKIEKLIDGFIQLKVEKKNHNWANVNNKHGIFVWLASFIVYPKSAGCSTSLAIVSRCGVDVSSTFIRCLIRLMNLAVSKAKGRFAT